MSSRCRGRHRVDDAADERDTVGENRIGEDAQAGDFDEHGRMTDERHPRLVRAFIVAGSRGRGQNAVHHAAPRSGTVRTHRTAKISASRA